jgi:peptidoglycan/xylan/chitin deacetylase (PgdA/CDA1 family)
MKTLILFLFSFNINACAVLLYHHFADDTPPSTSISPKLFANQLQYIKDNNFIVLSVKDLTQKLLKQEKLPNKCVVLTTDDAYTSIYKNAYPLLKQYNMPMAVFATTAGIDNYTALMTLEQMQQTRDYITYYNHSVDHSHFHTLDTQTAKLNILSAQHELEKQNLTDDKIFAYPYGEYNLDIYNLVKELGFVAFGQQSGAIGLNSDITALPRFPMTNTYGKMPSFITKINTIAMPLIAHNIDPIAKENPPILKLELKNKLNLSCFVNGKLIKNLKWQDNIVYAQASNKLAPGRNKYNCTAPSDKKGRYYWFSWQWIVN